MAPRTRRRVFYVGGSLIAAGFLVFATLPGWFPWAFRPIAQRIGLHYLRYERNGFHRFFLRGVRFELPQATVQAAAVESLLPTGWFWRRLTGNAADSSLTVADWTVRIHETNAAPAETKGISRSTYAIYDSLRRELPFVNSWLQRADLTNGQVLASGRSVRVPKAHWDKGILEATLALPDLQSTALFRADLSGRNPLAMELDSPTLHFKSRAVLTQHPDRLQVAGRIVWWENQVTVTGQFDRQGLWPERARLEAPSLSIPAAQIRLPGYETVNGSASFDWINQRFQLDLTAQAKPRANDHWPPFNLNLHAGGDREAAVIETAAIRARGIEAQLVNPTPIRFGAPFLEKEVVLNLVLDLGQQPGLEAQGIVKGSLTLCPGNPFPTVSFSVFGDPLQYGELPSGKVEVAGGFDFPWLYLTNATFQLNPKNSAQISARLDVRDRVLQTGRLQLRLTSGGPWFKQQAAFESAQLDAQAEGPLTNLVHSGQLQIGQATARHLNPLDLTASWKGEQLDWPQMQFKAEAGASRLSGEGSFGFQAGTGTLTVRSLALQQSDQTILELAQPFQARAHGDFPKLDHWELAVDPLRWVGNDRQIQLQAKLAWPHQGYLQLSLRQINLDPLRDFLTAPLPEATLDSLEFSAGWTNSPVQFRLAVAGDILMTNDLSLRAEATLSDSTDGLRLEKFTLATAGQPIITGKGVIPLSFEPTAAPSVFRFQNQAPLEFDATAAPQAVFWDKVAGWTGLRVEAPAVKLAVSGSWAAPRGSVEARIAALQRASADERSPKLENLRLRLEVNRSELKVAQLQFHVLEQLVEMSGRIPLGSAGGTNGEHLFGLPEWRQASGRLVVERADLAAVAGFFPKLLSPQGELTAHLDLQPGRGLEGQVQIHNLATRPLPSVGPIRDTEVELHFRGNQAELTRMTASLGGRPIHLTGTAWLPEGTWTNRSLPAFQINIRGTNLPLARRPEVFLRGDVNLTITNSPADPAPAILGEVQLRNSYLFSDLKALIPGKIARPEQHPPYFSVEQAPFDRWRLDVKARGDEFLKVRSPVFSGAISTTLQVKGTLREPVALGEVRTVAGKIIFPFATFQVTEGLVALTSANPHQPQLFVTATAQRLGYDLKLEVRGTASEPRLQFSSSPPLSPEQILLLVTAGQAPTQAGQLSTARRVQNLGIFVGRNLLATFGIGGADEERLTIQSGEHLTESGTSTYEVEYRLTKDWSIVGEYDRFNDFNVGLKWNVLSR